MKVAIDMSSPWTFFIRKLFWISIWHQSEFVFILVYIDCNLLVNVICLEWAWPSGLHVADKWDVQAKDPLGALLLTILNQPTHASCARSICHGWPVGDCNKDWHEIGVAPVGLIFHRPSQVIKGNIKDYLQVFTCLRQYNMRRDGFEDHFCCLLLCLNAGLWKLTMI